MPLFYLATQQDQAINNTIALMLLGVYVVLLVLACLYLAHQPQETGGHEVTHVDAGDV